MKDKKSMVMVIIIGITLSLFLCFNTTVFATTGTVTANDLRLRKDKSTSSEILELLDENTEVEVISEDGDWCKIKSGNKVGYVSKQYIKVKDNNNTTKNETKNEVKNDNNICKHDCNQLNGSYEWYKNKYEKTGIEGIPIMIHPSNIYNRECSPNKATRIITEKELNKLKDNINKFIKDLSKQQNYKDRKIIEALLNNHLLLGKQLVKNYTIEFKVSK